MTQPQTNQTARDLEGEEAKQLIQTQDILNGNDGYGNNLDTPFDPPVFHKSHKISNMREAIAETNSQTKAEQPIILT